PEERASALRRTLAADKTGCRESAPKDGPSGACSREPAPERSSDEPPSNERPVALQIGTEHHPRSVVGSAHQNLMWPIAESRPVAARLPIIPSRMFRIDARLSPTIAGFG